MDCFDWLHVYCAVYFSAGEMWSGYIRMGLWTDSLINAASVTGSLLDSALSDCSDYIVLLDFIRRGHFVVRTLFYLLDLCYLSGG